MKKKYLKPVLCVIEQETEELLVSSLQLNSNLSNDEAIGISKESGEWEDIWGGR